MATFTVNWHTDNLTGSTGYKVLYRVTGTPTWTSFLSSGSPALITGLLNNYIYDVEVQNLNNFDNPYSPILQGIGFTDPLPILSPTNSSIGFSFANLSSFMTSYTVTIASQSAPGIILQTQQFAPIATVSGTFSGLSPLSPYILSITPVAGEFSHTFQYNFVTTELAACAAPSIATAYISSGSTTSLFVNWTSPVPLPTNGFEIFYRTKGASAYTSFISSGSASTNSLQLPVASFTCYEGYVESLCSSGNISIGQPFGTNGYLPLSVIVSVRPSPLNYIATISNLYANPYTTTVSGTFIGSISGSHSYSATYPAGSTSAVVVLAGTPSSQNEVVNSYTIGSINPVFDNGGSLQQFDSVLTPGYFAFFNTLLSSGASSWNGNPALLPSFTLDRFEITEQGISGNVLAGTLAFSWISHRLYNGGVTPYNTVTFEIQDPANNAIMGTVTLLTSTLGIQTGSITLTKQITAISPTNLLHLIVRGSNAVAIGSALNFYLPTF